MLYFLFCISKITISFVHLGMVLFDWTLTEEHQLIKCFAHNEIDVILDNFFIDWVPPFLKDPKSSIFKVLVLLQLISIGFGSFGMIYIYLNLTVEIFFQQQIKIMVKNYGNIIFILNIYILYVEIKVRWTKQSAKWHAEHYCPIIIIKHKKR